MVGAEAILLRPVHKLWLAVAQGIKGWRRDLIRIEEGHTLRGDPSVIQLWNRVPERFYFCVVHLSRGGNAVDHFIVLPVFLLPKALT